MIPRPELTQYLIEHLSKFPDRWFTAPELARVITRDHEKVSEHSVRSVLFELQARGKVRSRPNESRSGGNDWQKAA